MIFLFFRLFLLCTVICFCLEEDWNLIFILILMICLISACTKDYTSKKYMQEVLSNLENIESASYNTIDESWVIPVPLH